MNYFFKKKYIFFIGFFILILGIFIKKLNLQVVDIVEKEKCPACYGISLCSQIDNNRISFEYTNFYSLFNNLMGIKNVYYGKYNNTKVVMKKLAHNSELKMFDQIICNTPELKEFCFNELKNPEIKTNFLQLIISELTESEYDDPNVKLRLCPTSSKLNELLKNIHMQNTGKYEISHKYVYLWTLIKINPEPIILQLLPFENGWPTPRYFGECGRLIVEEYVGSPLSAFKEEPWIRRAKIASSLLDAAYMFTFRHSEFAFYLTDVSMDNIVVDNENRAIFIDLENIIIVDKYPPTNIRSKIKVWNETHVSDIDADCEDCFMFSPRDICNHKISDHNYYTICQLIFIHKSNTDEPVRGFLHDTPVDILNQYPKLNYFMEKCSKPDTFSSRIDFGIHLKNILNSIIEWKTK